MAVRIRLARKGRLHRPFYRIVAIDGRCHREGAANEVVGCYDPLLKDKTITVDIERVRAWVEQGAQISEPLAKLLKHEGYAVPVFTGATHAKRTERAAAKLKTKAASAGKPAAKAWVAPSPRALAKHAARVKAQKKAAAAAAAPAADAAAAPA